MSMLFRNVGAGLFAPAGVVSTSTAVQVRTLAQNSQPKFIKEDLR